MIQQLRHSAFGRIVKRIVRVLMLGYVIAATTLVSVAEISVEPEVLLQKSILEIDPGELYGKPFVMIVDIPKTNIFGDPRKIVYFARDPVCGGRVYINGTYAGERTFTCNIWSDDEAPDAS